MPLCALCTSLPLLSPPPLSPAYNGYGLHSKSLKHLTSLRRTTRVPASANATEYAIPLGAAYHASLSSLKTAATVCAVCKVVAQQVTLFDEEWESTKDGEMGWLRRGHKGPDREMCVVRGVNDTGGFMVVCRDEGERRVVWVVAAVGLGVDDDDALGAVIRGRVVKERPEESLERAVLWVRECDGEHVGKMCHVKDTELPARVMDLETKIEGGVALIDSSDEEGSYAALSHTWGEESLSMMTAAPTETNRLSIDVDKLPKTFQDAVKMTRKLDLRYLWIDALCIPRGDSQEWSRSSAQVSSIYSNASIMLSATGSSSDNEGMFTVRSLPRRETFDYEVEGKKGIISVFPITRESAARRDNQTLLEKEPLSQRGWALQESYLAPRILHFGSKQMYFECHGHFLSEDGFKMTGRTNTLHRESQPQWIRNNIPDVQSDYDVWTGVLAAYARRALTKSSDKLPALSGLARAMEEQTGDQYVAGLWRSKLIEGLIWQAVGTTTAVAEYRAPSWSWAAIDGPFGMFSIGAGPDTRGRTDMATILDVKTSLKTENPYGEVTAGLLNMQAPLESLLPVDETSPGSGTIPKQKGARMKTQNGPEDDFVTCIFDTPTHADEAAEGPLWALLIARQIGGCDETAWYHGVVVKRVDDGGHYRRLGKLVCSESSLGKCDWMENKARMTSLTLV